MGLYDAIAGTPRRVAKSDLAATLKTGQARG